ncbi:hypothetical protein MHH87_09210 [Solibacillus sp. FSL H8-0538]|uniref:hypothetical protein n=1 Tax=Solibacillus sp. FSL H8-0538 TaxID=2921400 RepID=UPI0030F681B1
MISLISLLENIQLASVVVLALCSFFYLRQLNKLKRERKLTHFESVMSIICQLAYILLAVTSLLLLLGTKV